MLLILHLFPKQEKKWLSWEIKTKTKGLFFILCCFVFNSKKKFLLRLDLSSAIMSKYILDKVLSVDVYTLKWYWTLEI